MTIMVVVLLSETRGLGFAARLRTTVFAFSRGRQVIWVPAVPGRPTGSDAFPSKPAWPDDAGGAVPKAGESLKVPGGDLAVSSGPPAGEEKEDSGLFSIHGTKAAAVGRGGSGRRSDRGGGNGGRQFPGRRRRGRWKACFVKRSAP